MGLGKLRQDRYWVVADGKDSNTITREIGQGVLQLDELRLTERSPRGTAMKEHDRTSPGAGPTVPTAGPRRERRVPRRRTTQAGCQPLGAAVMENCAGSGLIGERMTRRR